MNIRDLKYVVEVAKYRHFTKAAKACFVSQSALSIQVKKFEDSLGVKIFERDNNEFLITPVGEKIVEISRNILQEIELMKNVAKSSQDEFSGDFKIGAFATLAPYYFPKIAGEIAKKFKNLKLFLVEEKTEKLIEMLKNGEIDAAFLADPIDGQNFSKKEIFEEKFLLAVSKENEFAKRKRVEFSELEGLEIMLLEEGHCLRNQALQICKIAGISQSKNYQASSLETLREMVKINAGITIMPEIAAVKSNKISYLNIQNSPKRKISLFWRQDYYRKNLIKKLAEIL